LQASGHGRVGAAADGGQHIDSTQQTAYQTSQPIIKSQ